MYFSIESIKRYPWTKIKTLNQKSLSMLPISNKKMTASVSISESLHKKRSFPLSISSVNVTISTVSSGNQLKFLFQHFFVVPQKGLWSNIYILHSFIKPFEVPQRSVEIKIYVNSFYLSGIWAGRANDNLPSFSNKQIPFQGKWTCTWHQSIHTYLTFN